MLEKSLSKSCEDLAYSKANNLTNEIYEETLFNLEQLLHDYSYSQVLGELSNQWSLEKAVIFFEKLNLKMSAHQKNIHHKVQTIGTHYYRAYNGGIERVQAQLINLWISMGYKVVLFTEEKENELDYPYPNSVKRIIIPSSSKIVERLDALHKHVIKEHVDFYVNHHWCNSSVLWECMLMKMINVPYAQYVHGHFSWAFSSGKKVLCTPRIFKLCDIVLSLSETNARFYQLCGCNSYIVQNPVPTDLAITTQNDISDLSSNHILLIGRLSVEKRPMDALRIFHLVHKKQPNAILDIIGCDEGNFVEKINKYCTANNLTDSVIYHGMKKQSDIAKFYRKSSLLLFTSEMEGYPMVLLESKAYGLPIVMYELPYLSLTKDGKGILTAPVGDITHMAEHIISLLENTNYRKAYGIASRESFELLNSYDLQQAWENIISVCSYKNTTINCPAYFNPNNLSMADQYIIPSLFTMIEKGYDNILLSDFDHKIGHLILIIPRFVVKLLQRLKRKLKK